MRFSSEVLLTGLFIQAIAPLTLAARIEIEGELFAQCAPAPQINEGGGPFISGGRQLSLRGAEPFRLRYEFDVVTAGDYTLWAKEYYRNGASPVRWRIDGGAWTIVKQSWGLTMSEMLTDQTHNDWGRARLSPGRHALEIESAGPVWKRVPSQAPPQQWVVDTPMAPGDQHVLVVDRFILTTEPLIGVQEWANLLKANGFDAAGKASGPADPFVWPWGMDDFSESVLDVLHPRRPITSGPESRIRRQGDRFVDAQGRPFRMWGMSVPTAPPKSEAEYYARRARRLGINVARFHSLDGDLCDMHAGRNYILDPDRLDRMEYFIHCLRQEGIYTMLDVLYNWHTPMVGPADGLPEGTVIKSRVRVPFYFDAALQKLNRDFIAKILTHKNPYTGLRNGEDPAVAFFQIVNENSLFYSDTKAMGPHFMAVLREQFNQWLMKKYGERAPLAAAWSTALKDGEDPARGSVEMLGNFALANARSQSAAQRRRVADECQFLYDTQVGFYNSVKDFVRKDLGFADMLFHGCGWWGIGWLDTLDTAANLPGMDFFDQHAYGKVIAGALAPLQESDSPNKGASILERFASKAPEGYPWTASEWNNAFTLDGPMLMAAYGALHGWDGLFQYRIDGFDGARITPGRGAPPSIYLQYPLASLAFQRGYVRESEVVWRHVIPDERLFDCTRTETPHNKSETGIHTLIGKCVTRYGAGEQVLADPARFVREDGAFVDSATGELTWDARSGALRIKAAQLQGLVGQIGAGPVDLGAVTLDAQPGFVSVVIAALDDRPLSESSRMFLCALAKIREDGPRDSDGAGNTDAKKKKAAAPAKPVVIQPVVGDVVFAKPIQSVFALDLSGKRAGEISLLPQGRGFRLDGAARTVWFEIRR